MPSRQSVSSEYKSTGKAARRHRSPLQTLHNGVACNGTHCDSDAEYEVCEEWASNAESLMAEVQRVEAILSGRSSARRSTMQTVHKNKKGMGYFVALVALEVTFVLWLWWTFDVISDFRAGTTHHKVSV